MNIPTRGTVTTYLICITGSQSSTVGEQRPSMGRLQQAQPRTSHFVGQLHFGPSSSPPLQPSKSGGCNCCHRSGVPIHKMESWHEKSCRRPDLYETADFTTCLNCGSSRPAEPDKAASGGNEAVPSANDAAAFKYSFIRQKKQIRLLRILPGDFDDPVSCTVSDENLGETLPPYNAISYTWADQSGDRSKCRTISLDSCPFAVTNSCELALRRVRHRDRARIVWVDAICINQADDAERSHQVQLMAQIYSRARCVNIYVGEAADGSTELLRFIADRAQVGTDVAAFDTAAAVNLLCRPYFWRVWILQEIALARDAILICGETTLPWLLFVAWVARAVGRGDDSRELFLARLPPHLTTDQVEAGKVVDLLIETARLPPALGFGSRRLRGPDELLPLLDIGGFCDASDPRDKLFALYGMVTGLEAQGLVPDYAATMEDVYTRLALVAAKECGVMEVLVRAVHRGCVSSSLPWVPDWRCRAYPFPSKLERLASTWPIQSATDGPTMDSNNCLHVTVAKICTFGHLRRMDNSWKMIILPARRHSIPFEFRASWLETTHAEYPALQSLFLCAPLTPAGSTTLELRKMLGSALDAGFMIIDLSMESAVLIGFALLEGHGESRGTVGSPLVRFWHQAERFYGEESERVELRFDDQQSPNALDALFPEANRHFY